MAELSALITSKIKIAEDDLIHILSNFQERTLEKDRFLIQQGQIVNSYYFIKSGGLRIYFNQGDRQITGWLAFENDFFTELQSFRTRQPTQFNIHAIENSVLLTIDKASMEQLYEKYPVWQQFGRLTWEDAFSKVVGAILNYQTMTAEERYLAMMNESELLQKVPLKQLASYLGVTETSLSRIRKKIK